MTELSTIQYIAVWVLPVLFAVTVHEVAHGWVALQLGDHTAQSMGRLTLNPLQHIDPVGTLIVPGILLFLGGIAFGWAKPVPVSWDRLRRPKQDMAIVAIAGPIANLIMAILWALITRLGMSVTESLPILGIPLAYMGTAGVFINTILMIVNLVPLPPLDGGRVLVGLLPNSLAYRVSRIEPYGILLLLVLLLTGTLWFILWPLVSQFVSILVSLVGIPEWEFTRGLAALLGSH
ncbi:site-2 protease family protein [Candidatus Nitrosacidococcus tergens]|uniref:Peptidase M50 n=1 Tax=Candidatus Nitrosacidococcus tergens TaxID=553981 RepID=A0A7G1QC81_9GAMM|nr:site-2 protease family protein [Candidatus Nitrosacidococcus tergens]CAB1277219.1 Peptidase M50 [Candidatus Nitrosacidococcus tergens]